MAFVCPEIWNMGVKLLEQRDNQAWQAMDQGKRCDACKFFVDSAVLSVDLHIYLLKGDTAWGDLKLNLNVPHAVARANGTW